MEDGGEAVEGGQYVLLELERCVPVVPGAVLIGSRLLLAQSGAFHVTFCISTLSNDSFLNSYSMHTQNNHYYTTLCKHVPRRPCLTCHRM